MLCYKHGRTISLSLSYFHSLSIIFSPNLQDFDQCYVYNYCFPLCEILEWFSHRVTIPIPPNVYKDSTWMGLALCVSVAVEANADAIFDIHDSETSYNLIVIWKPVLNVWNLSMSVTYLKKISSCYSKVDLFGYLIFHVAHFKTL